MQEEANLIANAIKSVDVVKDYIVPFIGSLSGFFVAYFTIRYETRIRAEIEKVNSVNNWTLEISKLIEELFAIKENYYQKLTKIPLQRALVFPSIPFDSKRCELDVNCLLFILKRKKGEDESNKHNDLVYIRSLITNYNYLLDLLQQRNALDRQLRTRFISYFDNKAFLMLSDKQQLLDLMQDKNFLDHISRPDLAQWIEYTELIIKLIDKLIIQFEDFLLEFPDYARTKICRRLTKSYGYFVVIYSNGDNKIRSGYLQKSLSPDVSSIQSLFCLSYEELNKRYE